MRLDCYRDISGGLELFEQTRPTNNMYSGSEKWLYRLKGENVNETQLEMTFAFEHPTYYEPTGFYLYGISLVLLVALDVWTTYLLLFWVHLVCEGDDDVIVGDKLWM